MKPFIQSCHTKADKLAVYTYIADTKVSHVFNHQITQILQQKEENTGINNTKISAGQLLNLKHHANPGYTGQSSTIT